MVSNKNTRQIKEMQKAFNNLKTFRLKSGKLKENGLWDEATKSAIAEFVKECRTSKFMQFLAKDPYNFVIIIDRINQNAGVGNSVLYQLFRANTRQIQRSIWTAGAKELLEKKMKCIISAQTLTHSLQKSPSPIYWGQVSLVVEKIIKLKKFRHAVARALLEHSFQSPVKESFSGIISLDIKDEDQDLYFSIGKIDIQYRADFDLIKGWVFTCHAKDTYDFDSYREIPYEEIFTKGLKAMFIENLGSIANNAGLLSQKDKAIAEYDIYINFVYYNIVLL